MNAFRELWRKLARSKRYREEFVAAQVKRGIPFQIRTLLKNSGLSQDEVASRANLSQGVISRAANPEYGNLTLNTVIRVAAGFDVAFVGKFVPFSELAKWFTDLSEDSIKIKTFEEEDKKFEPIEAVFSRPPTSTWNTAAEAAGSVSGNNSAHLASIQPIPHQDSAA